LGTLTVKLALPVGSAAYAFLKWYMVMSPAWGILLLLCLGPLFGLYEDTLIYVLSVLFAWAPLGVVSVLISLRLDFGSHASLPLYKIMIPLWAVDFIALVFPAALFLFALLRPGSYRPEHVSQSSVAWLVTWMVFGPFVVFEVLLAMYEYQQLGELRRASVPGGARVQLSAVRVFSPLFLWFSVLALVSLTFALCYRSEFQKRRRAAQHQPHVVHPIQHNNHHHHHHHHHHQHHQALLFPAPPQQGLPAGVP
jgi:hypothetical protein